jgi:hypothetical protein
MTPYRILILKAGMEADSLITVQMGWSDLHDEGVYFHSGFKDQHSIRIYTLAFNIGIIDDNNNGIVLMRFV